MDSSRRCEENDEETTKSKPLKLPIKQTKEKPALSPIEEETSSPDSSGDSTVNYHDIESVCATKKYPYDVRVGLSNDYEQVIGDHEEETPRNERRDESPPFLTARDSTDHEGGKYCDSSGTTSNERNSDDDDDDDDEEDAEMEEDSSLAGESTSGDVDYSYNEYYDVNDLETIENDDLEIVAGEAEDNENCLVSSRKNNNNNNSSNNKKRPSRRPKSAPSCTFIDSSDTSRDEKFGDISMTLDWLKARVVKSERDIFELKKQLSAEKMRGRKLARRYEEDKNVTRESLRIDLELWIKKLNDGLKGYLGEWQKRERLRLNEEISRISDLYSQEIAKSLKISLKEWHTEEAKNIFEIIERREKSREDNERVNAKVVYEKIQTHLENLEKRNRKSYATLCKQIDKWEKRLRDEIVKLHEEDLKKLRHQVNTWHEDGRTKNEGASVNRQMSRERCTEMKRSSSFFGAEALLQVEENLLKRLRDSSSRDLRRTEQIVRTELKTQRRELAKRMNDKIGELWLAFEEFGCTTSCADRERSRMKNHREDIVDNRSRDATSQSDVSSARWIDGKIVRSNRADGNSDVDGDDNRDYGKNENERTAETNDANRNIVETPNFPDALPEQTNLIDRKKSFTCHSTDRG